MYFSFFGRIIMTLRLTMDIDFSNMFFILLCSLPFCLASHRGTYRMNQRPSSIGQDVYPFQNYSLSWEVRADDLASRLLLEEIVNQTLAGIPVTSGVDRLGIKPYPWDTECLHGLVHTNGTGFPQSLGLSASFSEELLFNLSEAISIEARGHWNGYRKQGIFTEYYGLSCFSPVINIMRHPLWGRNQETYGEDPYLSGKLVQNFVQGLQGSDPRYVRANAGCKHFDVHGGPENIPADRMSFDSKVSMRDWRMTFLPQFKMCVEAGTYSLMCSFNSINGIPACCNQQLLTSIARTEWGFKGYVVSDAGAIDNIVTAHKYLKTYTEAAAASILAGCNLELGSEVFRYQLDALQKGLLTEHQIRANVRPLMYTRLRLGEFDPDSMNPYASIGMEVVQSEDHRKLAATAASMSFVLLKNLNNVLPIKTKYRKIAVVGPFAEDTTEIMGSYSVDGLKEFVIPLYVGLAKLADDTNVAPGCTDVYCGTYDAASVRLATADDVDVIFVALGTGRSIEGEGSDRSDLDLPGKQLQLLMDAVAYANGRPVILLLFNAGPLDITWAKFNPAVTAIMECFFPGQATGDAVHATLTASGGPRTVPAARLTATWPSYLAQVPPITDYNMAGHTYRYFDGEPLYPFGYGLSYSSFLYTSFLLNPSPSLVAGQNLTATVGVLNTGNYDADEVVQVYLSWPTPSPYPVPRLQLVAFTRLTLRRGEQKLVDLVITAERMAVWGDNDWTYIKGETTFYAGGQQPNQRTSIDSNVLKATVTVI